MITAKQIFDDYDKIDKENISVVDKIWRFIPKIIKILLNIRTNQKKIMVVLKVPLDTKEENKEE